MLEQEVGIFWPKPGMICISALQITMRKLRFEEEYHLLLASLEQEGYKDGWSMVDET